MSPKVIFGVNLNFSKFVYSPQHALSIVRNQLNLRHVEMVPDIDFGPVFYTTAPEAFRAYHWRVADHAREMGSRLKAS